MAGDDLELEARARANARIRILELERSRAGDIEEPQPEIKSADRSGLVGKALDWMGRNLDPVFSRSGGKAVVPQGYISDGKPVVTDAPQESGIASHAADLLETGAGIGGGVAGSAGGNFLFGPVGGYLGSGLGFETVRAGATQLSKALGLRPDTPENSWEAQKDALPENIAMDLAVPKVLQVGAKAGRAILRPIEGRLTRWGTDVRFFRNKGTNLASALTDNPRAYDGDLPKDVLKVPEIFHGLDQMLDPESLKNPYINKGGFTNPFEKIRENISGVFDPKTGAKVKPGAKDVVGQAVSDTLSKIPDKVRLRDLGLDSIKKKAEAVVPEVTARGASSVWDLELNKFAENILSKAHYSRYLKAKDFLSKAEGREAAAAARGVQLKPEAIKALRQQVKVAKATVRKAEKEVFDHEFSAQELREFKTAFDNNARYNRLTTPDNFADTRAGVYRDFGNLFRKSLDGVVAKQGDDVYRVYKGNMEKYGILSDIEPLIERRAQEAILRGPFFPTGAFDARLMLGVDRTDIPIVGSLAEAAARAAHPQKVIPAERLRVGLGGQQQPLLALLDASVSTFGGLARGAKGVLGGVDRGLSAESPFGRLSPAVVGAMQGAAFAEPTTFPRNSEAILQNKESFLRRLGAITGDANLTEATAQAINSGNPQVVRQSLSALSKQVPDLFEPSDHPSEMDGIINDPMEKQLFAGSVKEMRQSGKISATEAARQLSELNAGGRVVLRQSQPITPPAVTQESEPSLSALSRRLTTSIGERAEYSY